MSTDSRYVITPPPQAAIAVADSDKLFPVRRIWCVGRNYVEHIREMGQDERLPPFYFAKPADAVVATLVYRLLTFWLPLPIGGIAAIVFRRRHPKAQDVVPEQV